MRFVDLEHTQGGSAGRLAERGPFRATRAFVPCPPRERADASLPLSGLPARRRGGLPVSPEAEFSLKTEVLVTCSCKLQDRRCKTFIVIYSSKYLHT